MEQTAHPLKTIVQVRFLRRQTCSTGRGETLAVAIKNALQGHVSVNGSLRYFGSPIPDSVSVYLANDAAVTLEQIHDDLDTDNLRHCTQIIL